MKLISGGMARRVARLDRSRKILGGIEVGWTWMERCARRFR